MLSILHSTKRIVAECLCLSSARDFALDKERVSSSDLVRHDVRHVAHGYEHVCGVLGSARAKGQLPRAMGQPA